MRAAVDRGIGGLFAIAVIGILGWNFWPLDHLGIALALTFLCVDQGRMALVDLSHIRQVGLDDQRVSQFYQVTVIAIVLELVGFFLAWIKLGVGTALVLMSQIFFNTAAKIQLYPGSVDPIQPLEIKERSPVLIANTIALGLITLWQADKFRPVVALLLLGMVLTYLTIKYLSTNAAAVADGGESP
ncbi:hypothetical protein N836_09260 [Leptolyngbya sp. Heron Island J]|uniref:hypothetical protein n=1 Tax=Leptolyngbya sp. Heron Island J TaxID=1385935 RepID=UPI0003B9EB36|nr:hypothetical protein [Leptolyngbya sp. Heron Island J]ESA36000.1 hypothetical protein N836_09260 [Leptolyngbya sp. Heron Island J]